MCGGSAFAVERCLTWSSSVFLNQLLRGEWDEGVAPKPAPGRGDYVLVFAHSNFNLPRGWLLRTCSRFTYDKRVCMAIRSTDNYNLHCESLSAYCVGDCSCRMLEEEETPCYYSKFAESEPTYLTPQFTTYIPSIWDVSQRGQSYTLL